MLSSWRRVHIRVQSYPSSTMQVLLLPTPGIDKIHSRLCGAGHQMENKRTRPSFASELSNSLLHRSARSIFSILKVDINTIFARYGDKCDAFEYLNKFCWMLEIATQQEGNSFSNVLACLIVELEKNSSEEEASSREGSTMTRGSYTRYFITGG